MKIVRFFLVFLLGCFFVIETLTGQKIINEATLVYKISNTSKDKSDLGKSLEGASLTVFIKGNHSRTDMASSLGTETNFFDNKSGKGAILKEYSGQKLMITLNRENWFQKNQSYQNMKFDIDEKEQMINGFKCKKATTVLPNGNTFIVYFSPELSPANKEYNNAFKQLPGLPVQYELELGQLKFQFDLSSINYDPIPGSKFEIPKTGYRLMTYEETQQLKKGD